MKIHDFNLKMAFKTKKYLEKIYKGVFEVETANQHTYATSQSCSLQKPKKFQSSVLAGKNQIFTIVLDAENYA